MYRQDDFFNKTNCDRCGENIKGEPFIMSWFTEEAICMKCSIKEKEIREKMAGYGRNFEGCGYIPDPQLDPKEDMIYEKTKIR